MAGALAALAPDLGAGSGADAIAVEQDYMGKLAAGAVKQFASSDDADGALGVLLAPLYRSGRHRIAYAEHMCASLLEADLSATRIVALLSRLHNGSQEDLATKLWVPLTCHVTPDELIDALVAAAAGEDTLALLDGLEGRMSQDFVTRLALKRPVGGEAFSLVCGPGKRVSVKLIDWLQDQLDGNMEEFHAMAESWSESLEQLAASILAVHLGSRSPAVALRARHDERVAVRRWRAGVRRPEVSVWQMKVRPPSCAGHFSTARSRGRRTWSPAWCRRPTWPAWVF